MRVDISVVMCRNVGLLFISGNEHCTPDCTSSVTARNRNCLQKLLLTNHNSVIPRKVLAPIRLKFSFLITPEDKTNMKKTVRRKTKHNMERKLTYKTTLVKKFSIILPSLVSLFVFE